MLTFILAQAASPAAAAASAAPITPPVAAARDALSQFIAPVATRIADALGISVDLVQPVLLLGAKVILAILLLTTAWFLANWTKRAIQRVFARTELDETLERFFANAIRWVVLIIGLIICLESFGFSATSLVALLTTAGVAIGLALQGSLSHFASGVMILIFRPFKVTDFVTIAGREGTVDVIDLFTTTIDTLDNRRIIIPNGQIFGTVIENHTHHDRRMATIRITLSGADDPEAIRKDLLAAAHKAIAVSPAALKDPGPSAALVDLPGNQVWAVSVWCRSGQIDPMKEALWIAVKQAVEQNNHAVPTPIQLVKNIS